MPDYDQPHMLLAWGGTFDADKLQDVFAGSIRFAGQSGQWSEAEVDQADNDDVMLALISTLQAYWTSPGAYLRRDARLRWVKWNKVGANGKYASQFVTRQREGLVFQGASALLYPYQVALCTTYRTDVRRGLGASGRTYWPTGVPFQGTNGGITISDAEGIAAATADWISDMNDVMQSAGSAIRAAVMSNQREGATRWIRSVDVGNRFDIQRRRDNALNETRRSADTRNPGPVPATSATPVP